MPLYNNILLSKRPEDKKATQAESASSAPKATPSSSASMRFLQDHLMSKKRSKSSPNNQQVKKTLRDPGNNHSNSENTLPIRRFCGKPCDWDPHDEYDPMAPNSYEILQADYMKAEEQRLLAAVMSKQNKSSTSGNRIDTGLLNALDELDSVDDTRDSKNTRSISIAPPQPSSHIVASAVNQDIHGVGNLASSTGQLRSAAQTDAGTSSLTGSSHKADLESIEMKKNISLSSGQTKNSDIYQAVPGPPTVQQDGLKSTNQYSSTSAKERSICPTRVLLLQNMVGPGEVDDDLESETKEECSKYGKVVKCLIFEIPNKRVSDEQAVRIFIEFESTVSSLSALNDLNGRYFGGRVVKASFYDEAKFNRYELGP